MLNSIFSWTSEHHLCNPLTVYQLEKKKNATANSAYYVEYVYMKYNSDI